MTNNFFQKKKPYYVSKETEIDQNNEIPFQLFKLAIICFMTTLNVGMHGENSQSDVLLGEWGMGTINSHTTFGGQFILKSCFFMLMPMVARIIAFQKMPMF